MILFLSFKEITHIYSLEISVTHNKKRIPSLNLLINCMSTKWALQILSVKNKYTFLSLKFLMIGLCNSSASFLVWHISFFIPLPESNLSASEVNNPW